MLSILAAISTGLGLISGPVSSGILVVGLEGHIPTAFTASWLDFDNEAVGIQPVKDALFNHGSLDDQIIQLDQIEALPGDVIIALQSNVANALDVLQSNVINFRAFALHGAYIAPDADLNASTSILTQSMTTYVVS